MDESTTTAAPGAARTTARRPATRHEVGRHGEDLAVEMLERLGCAVVDRNWRGTRGELDVVATHGDEVLVVEVKTRTGPGFGHPAEAVTPVKLARLRRLAGEWLSLRAHELDGPRPRSVRIDVVAVVLDADGSAHLEHLVGVA